MQVAILDKLLKQGETFTVDYISLFFFSFFSFFSPLEPVNLIREAGLIKQTCNQNLGQGEFLLFHHDLFYCSWQFSVYCLFQLTSALVFLKAMVYFSPQDLDLYQEVVLSVGKCLPCVLFSLCLHYCEGLLAVFT